MADRPTSHPPVADRISWAYRLIQAMGGAQWGKAPTDTDVDTLRRWHERLSPLFGAWRYFNLHVEGWDNLPPPPVLFVSNHSGGSTLIDVWGLWYAWHAHFKFRRPIHALAHELVFAPPGLGRTVAQVGAVRASRRQGLAVLQAWRRDLLVLPGGELDTWRPFSDRYAVRFGGRQGYARLALATGVPVVPVAHRGAHHTLMVLTDGRQFARLMGLQRYFRAEVFPVHLSLPWGLTVGPWPHLPLPATLAYRFGAPIVPPEPCADPSREQVHQFDRQVREALGVLLEGYRVERPRRARSSSEPLR
jgi:1-acyl-sn-glycerol-3-phosphate acyltransferase